MCRAKDMDTDKGEEQGHYCNLPHPPIPAEVTLTVIMLKRNTDGYISFSPVLLRYN